MTHKRALKITLAGIITALLSIFCSSGYITPDSLTATAGAPFLETSLPTAFFVFPSSTATPFPSETSTPDPSLVTPIEVISSPTPAPTNTPTILPLSGDTPPLIYHAQSGDTLSALANRFSVNPSEIVSEKEIPPSAFIDPNQLILIPQRLKDTTPSELILPDSEVVYSPSTIGFDTSSYVNTLGGKLSAYREYLGSSGWTTGAEIVDQVAKENSINPMLLLSLIQYHSNWVFGQPDSLAQADYPLGYINFNKKGLHSQLVWTVDQLSIGYYSWRSGTLIELRSSRGNTIRLSPSLNAGSAALQYYFYQLYQDQRWDQAVSQENGLSDLHTKMFGDPWARAAQVEPLLPSNLEQPGLILPFLRNQMWAYTGGPHGAYQPSGSLAALDFAPGSLETGCVKSELWVLAVAAGVVVRMGTGVLVLDLDGDGNEQTGWVFFYLHLDTSSRIIEGQWVDLTELLGNPSCKGGSSTGTHIHIARKYNGEWIAADGPLPFNLGGWIAEYDGEPYQGYLSKGSITIKSCVCGSASTNITRTENDP